MWNLDVGFCAQLRRLRGGCGTAVGVAAGAAWVVACVDGGWGGEVYGYAAGDEGRAGWVLGSESLREKEKVK